MEVNLKKIKQNKVRKYVMDKGLDKFTGFAKMKALCYDPAFKTSYREHLESFLIKQNIDLVWNTYTTIHPNEAWNSDMVSFGLQYSPKNNSVGYLDDTYSGMETGEIFIINLRLLWGMVNIAVANKITEINEQERTIKLCYMEGGASEGSQWITLKATPEGFTEVSHLTLYKSKSDFRDTILYPKLHTKAITEFHVSVKKKAELLSS